jgi:hypothetical protein
MYHTAGNFLLLTITISLACQYNICYQLVCFSLIMNFNYIYRILTSPVTAEKMALLHRHQTQPQQHLSSSTYYNITSHDSVQYTHFHMKTMNICIQCRNNLETCCLEYTCILHINAEAIKNIIPVHRLPMLNLAFPALSFCCRNLSTQNS